MSEYIVKAQEEKLKAVEAAKAAVEAKYQGVALPAAPATTTLAPSTTDNSLYAQRNAKVSEAAKAGKSRWGDMEIKRAQQQVAGMAAAPVAAVVNGATSASVIVDVPKEVQEADHGLRADGGVGGPSLAERVAFGASGAAAGAVEVVSAPAASRNSVLYHSRNEMVTASAKAGKSRWGPMEVQKASELASIPLPSGAAVSTAVSPEVAAADHGLRNGSISLADRVNLGAQLLGS